MRQGGPCFGLIASLKIKIGLTFVSGIVLSVIFSRPSWGLLKPSICMLRNHISGSRGGLSLAQRRRLNSTALTRGLYTKKKECTEILVFFLSLSFPHSNEVRKSEVRQSKKKKPPWYSNTAISLLTIITRMQGFPVWNLWGLALCSRISRTEATYLEPEGPGSTSLEACFLLHPCQWVTVLNANDFLGFSFTFYKVEIITLIPPPPPTPS